MSFKRFVHWTAAALTIALGGAALASDKTAPPAPAPSGAGPAALPVFKAWTGDLNGMIQRRVIRALVVPSRMQYWVERGQQSGVEYELLTAFEKAVNTTQGTGKKHVKVNVVFIPTTRDDLIPGLVEGRGDIAAGILTITPERLAKVDFGAPFFRDVKEIVVTGPRSPDLKSVDDLSGQKVYTRPSSSYWTHLEALNQRFAKEGKAPVKLVAAPEEISDDVLLEMLNAGLFQVAVVDRYGALVWAKILKDIRPREEVVVNDGGEIAWMIRKGSPGLKAAIDTFAAKHGQGTLFGNSVVKKYTGSTRFVKPATAPEEMKKFQLTVDIFRRYADRYNVDYLLMMAQGYQESRLDHAARSPVGAIGIMQVMPATGKEQRVGDVQQLDPNIHAGVKYIRFVQDQYFADEPMDAVNKMLFSFAAYNAGPARVRQLRREAERQGLNPNKWFNNVELIAAERIGAETATYVANIFKYYLAYKLAAETEAEGRQAREAAEKQLK